MKSRLYKYVIRILILLVVIYTLLLIPDSKQELIPAGNKSAFVWDKDQYWSELEARFVEAKKAKKVGRLNLTDSINAGLIELESLTNALQNETVSPDSPLFQLIEQEIFDLSVLIGACPDSLAKFISVFGNLRTAVKDQSIHWNTNEQTSRDCIYRLIYGGRTAIEEIIFCGRQTPSSAPPE